jgi:hypothetical protein
MSTPNRLPLALGALAVVVAAAGLLAPLRAKTSGSPAGPGSGAVAQGDADELFELVLFGDSLDDVRLAGDTPPVVVYRVPAGLELRITDIDATAAGLVLLRRTQQHVEQVGFVVDRASVGLGQSARSYATGIPFGPEDELLVQAAGGDVEWVVLRGVIRPAAAP